MDNYNWMRSVDKRLHIVGDWVLPFAIPYRVIGLFVIVAVPQWTIMGFLGVSLSFATFWWYALPPAIVAAFANALKVQGKPLIGWILVNVGFWVRRPLARGRTQTRSIRLSMDYWRPRHPAYDWQTNSTDRLVRHIQQQEAA